MIRWDGVPAGAGLVNLPQEDNLTVAYAEVTVRPDLRRRGVGTAVLEEVERRSRAALSSEDEMDGDHSSVPIEIGYSGPSHACP